jgi:hypothetical protein
MTMLYDNFFPVVIAIRGDFVYHILWRVNPNYRKRKEVRAVLWRLGLNIAVT